MSDLTRVLVVLLAAMNPAGVVLAYSEALPQPLRARAARVAAGALIAVALVALATLTRQDWLGYLDISPESFDVAAGIVLVVGAAQPLLLGSTAGRAAAADDAWSWRSAVAPLAVPILAGPPVVVAVVSRAEHEGAAQALAAFVVASVIVGALAVGAGRVSAFVPRPLLGAITRLTAALLVAIGVGLIVTGVRSV
jgi:small neutral amino acid transporter SnatA (MarC family)